MGLKRRLNVGKLRGSGARPVCVLILKLAGARLKPTLYKYPADLLRGAFSSQSFPVTSVARRNLTHKASKILGFASFASKEIAATVSQTATSSHLSGVQKCVVFSF